MSGTAGEVCEVAAQSWVVAVRTPWFSIEFPASGRCSFAMSSAQNREVLSWSTQPSGRTIPALPSQEGDAWSPIANCLVA